MMKKTVGVLIIAGLIMTACSNQNGETSTTEDGKVVIDFWHNLDGDNAQTLEGMIHAFNEQSDTVEVNPSFQDNIQQQLRTVGNTDSAPAVFLGGDNAYYSQSGYIVPIEDMIEQDDAFQKEDLNEAVLENHSLDGKLNGMPFNVFVSLLFYNVEMFEEAGLDPASPPTTFSEVQAAASELTNDPIKGFSIPINTSFIYNLFAVQNELVYDNDNGRLGEAPTQTFLNSPVGEEIFAWIDDMNQAGNFGNYGRTWSNTQLAFSSGELAMYLDSSAVTGIWLETLDFEFATAPMPVPDGEEWAGVNQVGSQLWLSSNSTEEEIDAGWKFIKYMVSPEVQSEWSASTGYVPVTTAAVDISPLKETYEEHEQFRIAYDALINTDPSPATAGPSLEQLDIDEQIAQAFEKLVQGEDISSVLEEAETSVNNILTE
ncbi:ABC transporter substrate-binding protein [Gracilibacillus alcaliphilus]|nr:sn-glycerol 3-phosphate transport system substrate-binding protein [Gracilibacillus alcaliphilus]